MEVIIENTKATMKRRRELQEKMLALIEEYNDVPIMVCHRLNIFKENDTTLLDFTKGEIKSQVHIISHCNFIGEKTKGSKLTYKQ